MGNGQPLRPPFAGETREQLYAQVLHKEPVSPRKLNPKVAVDLDTICLKCLEKDPDRRYQTAKELADDLRRYVNRFAIEARRAGPLTKFKKWVRRNPAVAALGLAVCLALCAAGGFAWLAWKADVDAEKARAQERQKQRHKAFDLAMAFALAGNTAEAERKLAEAADLWASREDVLLVRGLIALYSGKPADAVGYFHQAIGAATDSVAAHSLLAYGYSQVGDWEAAERVIDQMKPLKPRDPRDKLFQGMAVGLYDPPAGVALMEQARHEGANLRIAPALLAEARIPLAMDTGRVAAARNDVEDAGGKLTPNPILVYQRVLANIVAATAYQAQGDKAGYDAARKAAAEASGDFDRLPNPRSTTAFTTRWMCLSYAAGVDGAGDFADPAYRENADEVWRDITGPTATSDRLGNSLRYAPFFRDGRERAILDELKRRQARARTMTLGEQLAVMEFAEGSSNPKRLVDAMTTNSARNGAYYVAGLKWLVDDDRGKAEDCFRKAYDLMTVGWSSWDLPTRVPDPDARPELARRLPRGEGRVTHSCA